MKVIEKIKKGLIGIGLVLLTIPTKAFSGQPDYGLHDIEIREPLSTENNLIDKIWDICRFFIIPIVLLIGIIIYLKKSQSSTKRKIITVVIITGIVAILYFVINYIINDVI